MIRNMTDDEGVRNMLHVWVKQNEKFFSEAYSSLFVRKRVCAVPWNR